MRVVWLHGWARRGDDFARGAADLADSGVASVALDLPGFGASPPPAARRRGSLLRRAGRAGAGDTGRRARWYWSGTPSAGRVATVMAAHQPRTRSRARAHRRAAAARGRPGRVALGVSPPVRVARARRAVSEARMEAARQRYGSADYRTARGVMRDVLVATVNESYEDELARVRAPARMLWGADDTEVPVDDAERARDLFAAGATLRVLEASATWCRPRRPTNSPPTSARRSRERRLGRRAERGPRGGAHRPDRALAAGPAARALRAERARAFPRALEPDAAGDRDIGGPTLREPEHRRARRGGRPRVRRPRSWPPS